MNMGLFCAADSRGASDKPPAITTLPEWTAELDGAKTIKHFFSTRKSGSIQGPQTGYVSSVREKATFVPAGFAAVEGPNRFARRLLHRLLSVTPARAAGRL